MIKDKHELAARLMILVQYQVCFARSLFERPGANEKGLTKMRKQSLAHEESEFLYLVFDCLHNVPELVSHLMQPDGKDAGEPDAFLLQLAAEKLEFLVQLTADSEKRRGCGIRDTDRILSWTHCGLSRIKDTAGTCSKLIMLLLQGDTE